MPTPGITGWIDWSYSDDFQTVTLIRHRAHPLSNQTVYLQLSGFALAGGSLPTGSGAIQTIRPVAVCTRTAITPAGYAEIEFDLPPGGVGHNNILFSEPTLTWSTPKLFYGSGLGSSDADVANMYCVISNDSSAFIDPDADDVLTTSLIALAVYYDAPALLIGHGANCNAYDPITAMGGAATPPGNGLLIS